PFFDSCEILIFQGRPCKVPHGYEQLLTKMYGDWQTPQPGKKGNNTRLVKYDAKGQYGKSM
ncbi:unnamed protein product, partial [marine sediment metagenome]